jgi:hypothetical protein
MGELENPLYYILIQTASTKTVFLNKIKLTLIPPLIHYSSLILDINTLNEFIGTRYCINN